MFQSKTARKVQYVRELIQQLHVTDSDAFSDELQQIILINSLVNLHLNNNNYDHTFETDQLLELYNNTMKFFQHKQSSSILRMKKLLKQCALNEPYLQRLKFSIEIMFDA